MLIVVMMGKWSDDSVCRVVHDVRLYSVIDTVVMKFVVVWRLLLWFVCLCYHQPSFPAIWPAVQSPRQGLSINPGLTSGAYVGAVEEMMCVMCVSVTKEE